MTEHKTGRDAAARARKTDAQKKARHAKSAALLVRLSESEHAALIKAAGRADQSAAEYVRAAVSQRIGRGV